MEKNKIDVYLAVNAKYFNAKDILAVKEKLENMSEENFDRLQAYSCDFINPTKVAVFSLLVGGLGIDRFFLGDVALGVLKLLTMGGCGVWTIIDWFLVEKRAKEVNFEMISILL